MASRAKVAKIPRPKAAATAHPTTDSRRRDSAHDAPRTTDAGNLELMQSLGLRAKLSVSQPGDGDEIEADRVAEAFVAGGSAPAIGAARGSQLQRACIGCEEDLTLRRQPESSAGAGGVSGTRPGPVGDSIVRAMRASQGASMPEMLRSEFAGFFGNNLVNVRLHTGPAAESAASLLSAQAFTRGNDVFFNRGRFAPESAEGRRLLAHELTHTLQPDATGPEGASVRRRTDMELEMREEMRERSRAAAEAARRRHARWDESTRERFREDIVDQSGTLSHEIARSEMTLEVERAAMFDAVRGSSTIAVPENLREFYAGATQATLAIGLGVAAGELTQSVQEDLRPVFVDYYLLLTSFAQAVETSQREREASARERLAREISAWEAQQAAMRTGLGDPGARAALGGWAMANPRPRLSYSAPEPASPSLANNLQRATTAADVGAWTQVLRDFGTSTSQLDQLLLYLLPADDPARQRFEYAAEIHSRLLNLETQHPLAFRVPAIFYPLDQFVNLPNGGAEIAEGMPWQFYAYHTGVTSMDQPARSGGEWVLVDITSPQHVAVNRVASSDMDAAMLQQGAVVDPPHELFEELNSRLRFPEGQLIIRMPSGNDYIVETTASWEVSDWLSAIGFTLAAIALIAGIVVSGGFAAPAAVPALSAIGLAAGLGSAGFSIASTVAGLEERRAHGILTEGDINQATIAISIDVAGALSLGLGRLVASAARAGQSAGAAARLAAFAGRSWFLVQRATQLSTAAALAGDVYQIMVASADFLRAYRAILNQPGLSTEQRALALARLTGTALLTGGLLALSVRGNVHDLRTGGSLHLVDIDADGRIVVSSGDAVTPRLPGDLAPTPAETGTHTLPALAGSEPHVVAASAESRVVTTGSEPEVHPTARQPDEPPPAGAALDAEVHARADRTGAELTLGAEPHAVSVAGRGTMRGFYFCSDNCGDLAHRLELLLSALPSNFANRELYSTLLSRVRTATGHLRAGRLSNAQGDALARQFSAALEGYGRGDPVLARLLNLAPSELETRALDFRRELAATTTRGEGIASIFGEAQALGDAPARLEGEAVGGGRSDLTQDILDEFGLPSPRAARDTPGGRATPLHFDVGNFGHTYAEELVPGLPRGLDDEVQIVLGDGAVRRADRVHFERDAQGRIIGGTVFEIKPDTARWRRAGLRQAELYAHYLSEIYPGSWTAVCLTYDADAVRSLVRQLRTPP
jgi:hypothetical protein